jgi:hypothetical protein
LRCRLTWKHFMAPDRRDTHRCGRHASSRAPRCALHALRRRRAATRYRSAPPARAGHANPPAPRRYTRMRAAPHYTRRDTHPAPHSWGAGAAPHPRGAAASARPGRLGTRPCSATQASGQTRARAPKRAAPRAPERVAHRDWHGAHEALQHVRVALQQRRYRVRVAAPRRSQAHRTSRLTAQRG